jgi:hypothetical protein
MSGWTRKQDWKFTNGAPLRFVVSRPFRKVREKDGARNGFIDPRVGEAGGRLIQGQLCLIADH